MYTNINVGQFKVSEQTMNQRNTSLDFLKVIAAFAVVWLHVSAYVVVTNPDVHSMAWWIGNIADSFSRWCVPVFVMISGALVFSSASNATPIEFYKKRASRLLPPIIIWTLVYFVVRKYTDRSFNLEMAASSIIKGVPSPHLWYLYMAVGLNLATPFLRPLVEGIDSNSLRLLVVGCFTIAAIEATSDGESTTFLPSFLPFIGYYLAGHYLSNHRDNESNRLLVSIFLVCGSSVAIGTGILLPLLGPRSWGFMYGYLNPVVIVMSLCIFLLVTKNANAKLIAASRLVPRIAPITLGIYCIHPLSFICLDKFGITPLLIHPAVGIPTMTFLAFILSALSSALLANIPIVRWAMR